MIGDKSCNFVALYRPPRQSQDEFETFSDNFEMTLETLAQSGSFLRQLLVIIMLNLITGTSLIKPALKLVPLKV